MSTGVIRLATLMVAVSMTACTVLPRPEPPRVMDLAPPVTQSPFSQPLSANIRVDTPLASDPLDSATILLKPTPYEFQAFRQARWRDSTPVVIRDHLARHLRDSRAFRNVVIETSPATSDLTLLTELSAFHIQYTGTDGWVKFELHAELVSIRNGQSLCLRSWSAQEPAAGTDLDSVVQAFSRASNTVANELTRWARTCVDREYTSATNQRQPANK